MKKVVLFVLLATLAALIALRPLTATEQAAVPTKLRQKVTTEVPSRWVEIDSGELTGTKVSIDLTSFEVISAGDTFEFITMLEYSTPQSANGQLVKASLVSTQISCKTKKAKAVRDISINTADEVVLHNMIARTLPERAVDAGSHYGDIAAFICTRGGTLGTEAVPAPGEKKSVPDLKERFKGNGTA